MSRKGVDGAQASAALGDLIMALQACIATARELQVAVKNDAGESMPTRSTPKASGDGGRPTEGPPRTGRALFAALCQRSEESGERDLVKKVQEWGKKRGWSDRMVDWSDAEVAQAWDAFEKRERNRTAGKPTKAPAKPDYIPLSELCGNRRFTVWLEDFCTEENLNYWQFLNHLVKWAASTKLWRVANPASLPNTVKVDWLDRAEPHFAALIAEVYRYRDTEEYDQDA